MSGNLLSVVISVVIQDCGVSFHIYIDLMQKKIEIRMHSDAENKACKNYEPLFECEYKLGRSVF